jgi:hypothetical protein
MEKGKMLATKSLDVRRSEFFSTLTTKQDLRRD